MSTRLFVIRCTALAGMLAASLITITSEAEETGLQKNAGVNLSEVNNAESTLTGAAVKDRNGAPIGSVHGMTRDAGGAIKTLQVTLAQPDAAGVVVLDAQKTVYLPASNVIVASISREEARSLPRLEQ